MATYAIGDLQGCYDELQNLLDLINFDSRKDQLWFVGDLVNRGPKSLESLRFIKSLGTSAITVLGNHDLHCLAVAYEKTHARPMDTLEKLYTARDFSELSHWLAQQPLIHFDEESRYCLVHAGIYPFWNIQEALRYAEEVKTYFATPKAYEFFKHMYGNEPYAWNDNLEGFSRLRFITNAFTRMRLCSYSGQLQLRYKGDIKNTPPNYEPWYRVNPKNRENIKIIFGHWASLRDTLPDNLFFIDTGCAWGGTLTALRLEDEKRFSVPSLQPKVY